MTSCLLRQSQCTSGPRPRLRVFEAMAKAKARPLRGQEQGQGQRFLSRTCRRNREQLSRTASLEPERRPLSLFEPTGHPLRRSRSHSALRRERARLRGDRHGRTVSERRAAVRCRRSPGSYRATILVFDYATTLY